MFKTYSGIFNTTSHIRAINTMPVKQSKVFEQESQLWLGNNYYYNAFFNCVTYSVIFLFVMPALHKSLLAVHVFTISGGLSQDFAGSGSNRVTATN